jgi:hypothetical protein
VRYLPAAEPVVGGFPGAEPYAAAPAAEGPAPVVVDLVQRGNEAEAITALGDLVGDRGVGVLILASPPAEMPVGRIVEALGQAGLRTVQAEGLASRYGRTVLALTRDREVPQRSYLLDQPVPSTDAAALRLANEWAVAGLQQRAASGLAEDQLAGARDEAKELRLEIDRLSAEWAAERARLRARIEELKDRGVRAGARKAKVAAGRVGRSPVKESKAMARSFVRRARG